MFQWNSFVKATSGLWNGGGNLLVIQNVGMARKSKREKMMTTCWGGGGVSREKTQVQKDYGFLAGKGKPFDWYSQRKTSGERAWR